MAANCLLAGPGARDESLSNQIGHLLDPLLAAN